MFWAEVLPLGEKILEGKETNLVTASQQASQQAKAKVAFDDLAVPEAVALIVAWSQLRLNQGKFTLPPTDSFHGFDEIYICRRREYYYFCVF